MAGALVAAPLAAVSCSGDAASGLVAAPSTGDDDAAVATHTGAEAGASEAEGSAVRGDADVEEVAADGPSTTTGTWMSGGGGDHIADGTFGTWRGTPVAIAGTWSDDSADNQVGVWSIKPGFEYGAWTGPIDIANGAIFGNETWAQAASGQFDDRWSQSLTAIRDARQGKGTTFIRFAHEFNGDWYWPVTPANVADFKAAWVRFATLKQSIFPQAKLVWCPNDGTTASLHLDVRTAYPGAAYVDVIAVDSYNWDPAATTQAEFDAKIHGVDSLGAPLGLESWRQFAQAQGKPFAIPEWSGVADQGDNPQYMTALHAWLAQHGGTGPGDVLYEIVFNTWDNFRLYPTTNQPDAAERYRAVF